MFTLINCLVECCLLLSFGFVFDFLLIYDPDVRGCFVFGTLFCNAVLTVLSSFAFISLWSFYSICILFIM